MSEVELKDIQPDASSYSSTSGSDESSESVENAVHQNSNSPALAAPVVEPAPPTPRQDRLSSSRRSSSYKIERRTTDIMSQFESVDLEEEKRQDAEFHPVLPHFRAILFRRFITIKRTWLSVLLTIICTVIVSCLAIICQILVESLVKPTSVPYTYDNYQSQGNNIVLEVDPLYGTDATITDFQNNWIEAVVELFHNDTGRETIPKLFNSHDTMLKYMYDMKFDFENPEQSIIVGMILPTPDEPTWITLMYNDTQALELDMTSLVDDQSLSTMNLLRTDLRARLLYVLTHTKTSLSTWLADTTEQTQVAADLVAALEAQSVPTATAQQLVAIFSGILTGTPGQPGIIEQMQDPLKEQVTEMFGMDFRLQMLPKKVMDKVFSQLGPLLIMGGITSVMSTFITPPIQDINGPIREYMISCTLSIFPYWFATFIVDFIVWTIDITVVWAVFLICQIKAFTDNAFNSWFVFFIGGLSFIPYIYCTSFCFSNADMAARNAFIINVIMLIIPVIIDLVQDLNSPTWINWIYCLFPNLVIQRFLREMFLNIGVNSHSLSYYYEDERSYMFGIFQWLGIILWCGILTLIELSRTAIQRRRAASSFGDYSEFFRQAKAKHPVTQEADDMAEEVANNHDYAVRIENCSRLFFNTAGDPIPAVNCVSLGVKKGATFGFLGANGAGKTTLISMITSMLPISDGTIEINGVDITKENDPTLLSVCPQFNTHLCVEMTPGELFHFYSMLHQMSPDHEKRNTEKLLQLLDLNPFRDTPIRELSEGDVRKVAIALSFLGRAEIILLDEPTATLDPVSRHQVHEMISFYKGKKTFMLCTHLLSEAETLCEMISIMIKGNVYTCGSPQYLAAKFGTDFKIDMMLNDESDENAHKVDAFFAEQLPQAQNSIKRPTARIYNVPAASTTLATLFEIMEKGKEGDCGFNYYTCSSSSLERVFMEIVRISEGGDDDPEAFKHIAPTDAKVEDVSPNDAE